MKPPLMGISGGDPGFWNEALAPNTKPWHVTMQELWDAISPAKQAEAERRERNAAKRTRKKAKR